MKYYMYSTSKTLIVFPVLTKSRTGYKSLTAYHSRYHYYNENFEDGNETIVFSEIFTKQFASTSLRLTASGSHRIKSESNVGHCGRWYVVA